MILSKVKKIRGSCRAAVKKVAWYTTAAFQLLQLRTIYRLRIMNAEETIQYIKDHHCSIARYGDGEFNIMLQKTGIGFQDKSPQLADSLIKTLQRDNPSLLICVPWSFNHLRYRNRASKRYWVNWAVSNQTQKNVVQYIRRCRGKWYLFGDAQITRPYIAMSTAERADVIFPMLRSLWDGRDLMLVEGELTRMGIGNDLFSNAKSIVRVLAPAKNAFDFYDQIIDSICANYNGQLVLLALGPTATTMADALSNRGIQALDIGHIDVEYEWYLQKATDKVLLNGKYVNELAGGNFVDSCDDPEYLKQIVARVGC